MYFQFFFILFLLTRSKRIFTESRAKYNLKQSHSIYNGSTDKNRDSYGVCLFCHTTLSVQYWTDSWAKKFLSYMKQVLISSILRQCELQYSCSSMRSSYLLLRVKGSNSELDLFIQDISQMINLRVYSHRHEESAMIERIVDEEDCKWLSSVFIEPSNGFLDGYFDYLSSELTGKLVQTLTMDGLPWRGAVFGTRSLSRLIIGKGRCTIEILDQHFWSGSSQCQGFLLRREVWEKIGRRSGTRMRGMRTGLLRNFRNDIMKGIGFDNFDSDCCVGSNADWTQSHEQIALENIEAANTRIMFIDVSLERSSAAVLIETPFSNHFQWNAWQDMPVCGEEQKKIILGEFPRSIEFILNIIDLVTINITFEDACGNIPFVFLRMPGCPH